MHYKKIIKWFGVFIIYMISAGLHAEEVAITMDDPNLEPTPMLSPIVRDQRILHTLKKNHLKIVLFVRGKFVDRHRDYPCSAVQGDRSSAADPSE